MRTPSGLFQLCHQQGILPGKALILTFTEAALVSNLSEEGQVLSSLLLPVLRSVGFKRGRGPRRSFLPSTIAPQESPPHPMAVAHPQRVSARTQLALASHHPLGPGLLPLYISLP